MTDKKWKRLEKRGNKLFAKMGKLFEEEAVGVVRYAVVSTLISLYDQDIDLRELFAEVAEFISSDPYYKCEDCKKEEAAKRPC